MSSATSPADRKRGTRLPLGAIDPPPPVTPKLPAEPRRRRPARRPPPVGPVCGYVWDDVECVERGRHRCAPRVTRVVGFFRDVLVHTKGQWARRPFVLAGWQVADIVGPLFGEVVWSTESRRYVRRYRIAWIELGRKNGKSELLAGIALYLLVGDDEEGAEIYSCARDRDQARKVFDVAERMVRLSAVLSRRLTIYKQAKRIVDELSGSFYEIVPADAAGNLGHNPHGVIMDEVITQRDGSLWSAMRTAMGTRTQALMVAATTAGDDLQSFAYAEHLEMQRIADEPERTPHAFVHMRNVPRDADPFDERVWEIANPGLHSFLSVESLREEALEARNDPTKENSFRQFRCNQWVSQASRWMPMHTYDASSGNLWLTPDHERAALAGRTCYAGMDLAAKFDLVAWCLIFPGVESADPVDVLWRFWIPEDGLRRLDRLNDGKFSRWAKAGWLTVTEGSIIDYDRVVGDIALDAAAFALAGIDCDEWSMWPVINRVATACGLDAEAGDVAAYKNTYDRMSPGMGEVFGLVKTERFHHHGNPLARFCFDACEVRRAPYDPNLIRPSKPERGSDRARIDGVPTAAMAANAWKSREDTASKESPYESERMMVV